MTVSLKNTKRPFLLTIHGPYDPEKIVSMLPQLLDIKTTDQINRELAVFKVRSISQKHHPIMHKVVVGDFAAVLIVYSHKPNIGVYYSVEIPIIHSQIRTPAMFKQRSQCIRCLISVIQLEL